MRAEKQLKQGKRDIERENQAEYDRVEREKQLARRKTIQLEKPEENSVEIDSPSKSPNKKGKGAKGAKAKPKDKKKK